MQYEYSKIEKKWQDRWDKENPFAAKQDYTLPKFYALVEFPYPSGHVLYIYRLNSQSLYTCYKNHIYYVHELNQYYNL